MFRFSLLRTEIDLKTLKIYNVYYKRNQISFVKLENLKLQNKSNSVYLLSQLINQQF